MESGHICHKFLVYPCHITSHYYTCIRESQTQLLAINFASPVAPGFESPDPVPARLPVVGEGLVEDGLLVLHKTHQQ